MDTKNRIDQEKLNKTLNGGTMLFVGILLLLASVGAFILGIMQDDGTIAGALIIGGILGFIVSIFLFIGLKIVNPNEAMVLVLFGNYYASLKQPGFFWVNPFCVSVNPGETSHVSASSTGSININLGNKKMSLKAMTLNNEKQTVNDQLGNPIIIGTIVIWQVVNTAKAVFNVNNYKTFLSTQCDSAIRNVTRLYPYDITNGAETDEMTLRGSSQEVADTLQKDLQARVDIAGLEILEVRITHLSYAPEIAAAMLQRQQAEAIIAARQKIVEGAVSMVEMALTHLSENNVVTLDEERKAAMVSNLLVVLCGNRDVQPVVNSGSIY